MNIKINGTEYFFNYNNKTILNICRENNIFVPTLCFDERLTPFGSCWMCIVEIKNRRGVYPSCSTIATDGMEIFTESPIISELRKMNLELLFSNHYGDCFAPCKLNCPSNVDVQGYIALINKKEYSEAIKLIKQDCPMPAAIGRICPRPCEDACRRIIVDNSVSIDYLKRFAADMDLNSETPYIPRKCEEKNIKVAIIGAGPAGLSCAYYLSQKGYIIDIFDMMAEPGGMLRYGIPEYRLPKKILQKEINVILKTGNIKIYTNKKFGSDFTIDSLKKDDYKSIFIAIGAWKSNLMSIPGETLNNVWQGIDFLKDVILKKINSIGKKVAVIGGGNTAIDAARTALRLGAERVYIIYRRTEKEMPAHRMEIKEAKEEGVEFLFLTNPVKYIGDDKNNVKSIECIKMKLGEPDASGRRKPVPVEESNFLIESDYVISALGQSVDTSSLNEMQLSKWNTILINEENFSSNIEGVFAGGDAVTGADTAIRAMNAGKLAANSIDEYLKGNKEYKNKKLFFTAKDIFENIDRAEYNKFPKLDREELFKRDVKLRCNNFIEVENGYTEEQALRETRRCLSCGCVDVFECKLKEFGELYNVELKKFNGKVNKHPIDISHPFILREPSKCIHCGKCIRICLEYQGPAAFGYIYRGFDTVIGTKFNQPLVKSECTACGQCIAICPTGALSEKVPVSKIGPYRTKEINSRCNYCSINCKIIIRKIGNSIIAIRPEKISEDNYNILCVKGKFSYFKLYKKKMQVIDTNDSINKINEIIKNTEPNKIIVELVPSLFDNQCENMINYYISNYSITRFKFIELENYIEFRDRIENYPVQEFELLKYNQIIFIGENYNFPDYEVIIKKLENNRDIKIISITKNNNPFDEKKIFKYYKVIEFDFEHILKIISKYKEFIFIFDCNQIPFIKEFADYLNRNKIKYFLASPHINLEGSYRIYKKYKNIFTDNNNKIDLRISVGVENYSRKYPIEIITSEYSDFKDKNFDYFLPTLSKYEIEDEFTNHNGAKIKVSRV